MEEMDVQYLEYRDEFYYYHEESWWVVLEQDDDGLTTGAEVIAPWVLH
jgi:hypothetical protein